MQAQQLFAAVLDGVFATRAVAFDTFFARLLVAARGVHAFAAAVVLGCFFQRDTCTVDVRHHECIFDAQFADVILESLSIVEVFEVAHHVFVHAVFGLTFKCLVGLDQVLVHVKVNIGTDLDVVDQSRDDIAHGDAFLCFKSGLELLILGVERCHFCILGIEDILEAVDGALEASKFGLEVFVAIAALLELLVGSLEVIPERKRSLGISLGLLLPKLGFGFFLFSCRLWTSGPSSVAQRQLPKTSKGQWKRIFS